MEFLSLNIYQGKYQDFLERMKNPQKKLLVFTPNPEILLRASRDTEFLEILRQADYLTPDGNGLYTGSLIQQKKGYFTALLLTIFSKQSLRQRYGELISGSNLTKDLVDFSIEKKKKILMIDNYRITNPTNEFEVRKMYMQWQLQRLFSEKFPELNISIVFDNENSSIDLVELIQNEQISYVFSCIGMKTQEQRLLEIFAHIPEDFPVVWLGVGSSIDYLLGLQKRAPVFFQKLGLEWLYRLIFNPRKRWCRIWDAVIEFPRMVKKSVPKK